MGLVKRGVLLIQLRGVWKQRVRKRDRVVKRGRRAEVCRRAR